MSDDDILKAISNPEPAPPPPPMPTQPPPPLPAQPPIPTNTFISPVETGPEKMMETRGSNKESEDRIVQEDSVCVSVGTREWRERKDGGEKMRGGKKDGEVAEDSNKSILEEAVQMVFDVSDVSDDITPSPPTEGQGCQHLSRQSPGSKRENNWDKKKKRSESKMDDGVECVDVEKISPQKCEGISLEERTVVDTQTGMLDNLDGGRRKRTVVDTQTGMLDNLDGGRLKCEQIVQKERTIINRTGILDNCEGGCGTLALNILQSTTTEDATELLEMKLRRRALESELRRRSREKEKLKELEEERVQVRRAEEEIKRQKSQRTRVPSERQEHRQEEEDVITLHPGDVEMTEEEGEEMEEEGSGSGEGELLEEELRKRALQSMWARRKSKDSSDHP